MLFNKLMIVTLGIAIPFFSMAQESESYSSSKTYSFGGACQSQGVWTADALMATSSLQSIAEQLKNDKNCNSLAKKLENYYAEIKPHMDSLRQDTETAAQLSQVSENGMTMSSFIKDSSALKSFLFSTPQLQGQITSLLTKNLLESSITNANLQTPGFVLDTSKALYSMGKRIGTATRSGMDIATNVLDSLLTEQQCLTTNNQIGPIISAMVSMASSMVSSRQDSFGNKTARFINKLSMFMRNKRFVPVFRELNEIQFRNSLSCLLEVSSESYCSALDAQVLFDKFMKENSLKENKKDNVITVKKSFLEGQQDSPLRGLYILTQQIPIVTLWLERIQRGVEPVLKTDAVQKNDTILTTMQFFLKENVLLSTLNSQRKTLDALPNNIEAQKNHVIKTIIDLTDIIKGGAIENSDQNFYTTSSSAMLVPFRLMGIQASGRVTGEDGSAVRLEFSDWLQGMGRNHEAFKNPKELYLRIEGNLKNLIAEAKSYAIAYYNNWYIYDQPGLFVDSLTGVRYNVREVLENTLVYLHDLADKIKNDNGRDSSLLATIYETTDRIQTILSKYKQISDLGEKFKTTKDKNEIKKLKDIGTTLHVDLIKTVYDNFNVFIARSGFISTRLNSIVKADMQNLIRSINSNSADREKLLTQIFIATGEAAFENMRLMSGGRPTDISLDIANARLTHSQNLSALEVLIKDYFLENIKQMKSIVEQSPDADLANISRASNENSNGVRESIQNFFNNLRSNITKNPNAERVVEVEAAKKMYNMYCIQSLAFKDWQEFQKLCKNAVLQTEFNMSSLQDNTKLKYESLLNANYNALLSSNITPNLNQLSKTEKQLVLERNRTDRICAFRQFTRNNYIMYLTLGLRN